MTRVLVLINEFINVAVSCGNLVLIKLFFMLNSSETEV